MMSGNPRHVARKNGNALEESAFNGSESPVRTLDSGSGMLHSEQIPSDSFQLRQVYELIPSATPEKPPDHAGSSHEQTPETSETFKDLCSQPGHSEELERLEHTEHVNSCMFQTVHRSYNEASVSITSKEEQEDKNVLNNSTEQPSYKEPISTLIAITCEQLTPNVPFDYNGLELNEPNHKAERRPSNHPAPSHPADTRETFDQENTEGHRNRGLCRNPLRARFCYPPRGQQRTPFPKGHDNPAFDNDHEKRHDHKTTFYKPVWNSRRSTREEKDMNKDIACLREMEGPLAKKKLRRSQVRSHKIRKTGVRRIQMAFLVLRKGASVCRQIVDLLKVWRPLVRKVDSRFGASGVAVFNFILDLLVLNILLSILTLSCVVLPTVLLQESEGIGSKEWLYGWQDRRGKGTNSTVVGADADGETGDVCVDVMLRSDDPIVTNCSLAYRDATGEDWCHIAVGNHTATSCDGFTWWLAVVIQGQGFLEISPLFLGYYPARLTRFGYPVATMQVLAVLAVFLVSLITVMRRVGGWLRYKADVWGGLTFSRTVFSGWNFSLRSSRAVASMQHIMKTELLAALEEARFQEVKARRTRGRLALLYFGRFFVNCVIFALIIVNWAFLYGVIVRRAAWADWVETLDGSWGYISLRFIVDFADTLVVWVQSLILPPILLKLGALEQCSSRTSLLLYILRSSAIRLASLAVLVFTHLSLAYSRADGCRPDTPCWETHLAQNLYAQVVWSFVVKCFSALLCLAYTIAVRLCCFCCAASLLPEFDVPNKVLDILSLQTLCWLGVPVSPLMPVLVLLYLIVSFGMELVDALVISRPSAHIFQASRSSSMFMVAMAMSWTASATMALTVLVLIPASPGCGPFRGLRVAWSALTNTICDLSGPLRDVFFALDDLWVSLVLAGLLTCFATYYILVLSLRENVIRRLEDRLKEVAMDKAFFRRKQETSVGNGFREERGFNSGVHLKRNNTL